MKIAENGRPECNSNEYVIEYGITLMIIKMSKDRLFDIVCCA